MGKKDLTPQPPSLQGLGEHFSPLLAGEGLGERSSRILKFTHILILDALVGCVKECSKNPKDNPTKPYWCRVSLLGKFIELGFEEVRHYLFLFEAGKNTIKQILIEYYFSI